MKGKQKEFIEELFGLLADNKKFPSYQAERRIDIFINFFLEEILTYAFPGAVIRYVAPEFPLKKDRGNQSTNVDYLCVKEENGKKKILFVELKTDAGSFNKEQYRIYLDYKTGKNGKTWGTCLADLGEIATSKGMLFDKRKKYYHLLKALYHAGVLDCKRAEFDNIDKILERENVAEERDKQRIKRQFTQALKRLAPCLVPTENLAIDIVYLAPDKIRRTKGLNDKQLMIIPLDLLPDDIVTKNPEIWKIFQEMLSKI